MKIILPIKPLSYNGYYRNNKSGKRIKTGKGLAFDEELGVLLEDHADALVRFGRTFDPSKDIISLTIRVGNPKFFIKDGSRLSKTSGDVDNYIKVLKDKIFKVMGVDDYADRRDDVADFHSVTEFTLIVLEMHANFVIRKRTVLDHPELTELIYGE